jgi:uncharacterized coiled-coil DUF342 family protein
MLAAIIVLGVVVCVMNVFIQIAWSKIDRMEKKLNELLSYGPYSGESCDYFHARKCKSYDTKPEFVKGIDEMLEEIRRMHERPTYSRERMNGVTRMEFEDLEQQLDEIKETAHRFNARISNVENTRVCQSTFDLLEQRVDNISEIMSGLDTRMCEFGHDVNGLDLAIKRVEDNTTNIMGGFDKRLDDLKKKVDEMEDEIVNAGE